MKKRSLLVLTLLIIVFCISTAYSEIQDEWQTVYVPDVKMSISVPANYYALTKGMKQVPSALAALGFTVDYANQMLEQGNFCVDFVSHDFSSDIVVSKAAGALPSYSGLSEELYDFLLTTISARMEELGVTVHKNYIYKTDEMVYLVTLAEMINENGQVQYNLQYYTESNYTGISVKLVRYGSAITAEEEVLFQKIVDSIVYGEVITDVQMSEVWYTDPDNGTTFQIPMGWKESAMSNTKEFLQVKYVSDNSGAAILYGSADAWLAMSEAERAVCKARGQTADNYEQELTMEDVMDIYGIAAEDIQTVTYGGQNYYRTNVQIGLDVYNIPQNMQMTQLIAAKGRWLYMFQYMAHQGKPDEMAAFEAVMDTVKLAGNKAEAVDEDVDTAVSNNEEFVDPISGISFAVPVGWDIHIVEQDKLWIEMELYQTETGPRVGYNCEDVWGDTDQATIEELVSLGYSRSDVDNDFIGIAYQAEFYGLEEKDISVIKIAGQEYFVLTVPLSYKVFGIEVTMDALVFECYRDGYCHTFSLGGMKTTDADQKVFMELLNTVSYPQIDGK